MTKYKVGSLAKQFEKAKKYYDSLPDWKKQLIKKEPRK